MSGLPEVTPAPAPAADLVRRIAAGDPAAEAELVARFSRAVSFLLRRLARDDAAAEDLHQETFRLVIEKVRRGELREPEKLPGFVSAMARNLFLGSARLGSRRRRWQAGPEAALAAEATPDPAPGQLSRLLAAERAATVRRVMAELKNERDREILYRCYIAEEDKDAICRDLGLSLEHFHRVLFRARRRYREIYERRQEPRLAGVPPPRAAEAAGTVETLEAEEAG